MPNEAIVRAPTIKIYGSQREFPRNTLPGEAEIFDLGAWHQEGDRENVLPAPFRAYFLTTVGLLSGLAGSPGAATPGANPLSRCRDKALASKGGFIGYSDAWLSGWHPYDAPK